jgi:PBP1b-binding outer membrane lipoprotein LpoB
MPAVKKIMTEKGSVTLTENVKDYQNDPFVLKKVARAKEVLSRPGMQEQLKKITEIYNERPD